MNKKAIVQISSFAEKQLKKIPENIVEKVKLWIIYVEDGGLDYIKTRPGLHDEPLKGKRKGQRSIRLNRSYRLIYVVKEETVLIEIIVLEVNNHEY